MSEGSQPELPGKAGAQSQGVLCAGLFSSGSTWAFNVAVQLYRLVHPAEQITAIYVDEIGEAEDAAMQGSTHLVLKAHKPSAAVRSLSRLVGMPILLTVRDPRDAVASLMTRFEIDFESALSMIEASAHAIDPLLRHPNVFLLRYEDRFTEIPDTIEGVARCLHVPLTAAERDAIFARLTPEAVTATIADLKARAVFADVSPGITWDPETHWHPSHVGDRRVGKWPEVLTQSQAARVAYVTRRFRKSFGYDGGPPIGPTAELDFSAEGTGVAYLEGGFSSMEPFGIWTDEDIAILRLRLQESIGGTLHLELLCLLGGVVLAADRPGTSVLIAINGRPMTELRASSKNPNCVLFSFDLVDDALAGLDEVEVRFAFTGLLSPAECGLGADPRRLGLGLYRMKIMSRGSAGHPPQGETP